MTTPYTQPFQVFPAATALTATKTLGVGDGTPEDLSVDVQWAGRAEFQYVGTGFTGTLEFKGRPNNAAAWVTLPFAVLGVSPSVQSGPITLTVDSSTITYVVLFPMAQMQVVMTRSVGSLALQGRLFEHPWMGGGAPGAVANARSRGTQNSVSPGVRPANTTAYTALDALSNSTSAPTVWTFPNVARAAGLGGLITKAIIATDQVACVARFRLHLYNAAPTAINDNGPATSPLLADSLKYVGKIDFAAAATEGSGADQAYAVNDYDVIEYITAADANLYGILETLDAFTPASGQKFDITLMARQD